uniref:T9SS type A sorting domain-containing protein n=1 Tax=Marinifilum flexuosum TaxID=1117708 RepID=UPI0024950E81
VRTFTVNKAAQAITFAELADKTYGDAAFALAASASSSLAVSFEVVSGPASIKGNELTITGAGEVSIKAIQLGDEYYAAAESVTRAFDVFKADQQISFESIEDYILGGDPIELIAESNSGLEVEFEIVEGEGEVDGNLLSPASVGNFVVRAYQSGDENYNSAESTQEFMVDQATGIEDVFAEQMKMYPNPATDFVNLKFPDSKLKQIVLLNAAGQVIKTVTAYKELRLNVQNLRTGVYFVSVKSEGFVVTKRLMVVNR